MIDYGGSLFARYRLVPQLYADAEYQVINYETFSTLGESSRDTVSFLLLSGGGVQPLGGRTSASVEVLVDVLQDSGSPYEDWQPVASAGVAVGFQAAPDPVFPRRARPAAASFPAPCCSHPRNEEGHATCRYVPTLETSCAWLALG